MSRPSLSDDKRSAKRTNSKSNASNNINSGSGSGRENGGEAPASAPLPKKKPSVQQMCEPRTLINHRFPTYPNPVHLFDEDELPISKSHRKMARKRELRERREEQETVLQLIDSMRYGGEPNLTGGGRTVGNVQVKNARIAGGGFRVHWARLKQRLGTGSAPSESLLENSGETSDGSRSVFHWNRQNGDDIDDAMEVDEVVVDNTLGTGTSHASEHAGTGHESARPEPQGGLKSQTNSFGTIETHDSGFWGSNPILRFIRYTAWPVINDFFRGSFVEERMEREYRRELWLAGKTLALYSSAFFFIHWILVIALSARPFTLSDEIFFFGIGPLISIPLPILVIFDYPFKGFRKQIIFQLYLSVCVWAWAIYTTSFMYVCDFYEKRGPSHCGSRDFIGVLFFAVGLPAIALFGLRQSRIIDVIGFCIYFIVSCALLLPEHSSYARNVIDALLFHVFLLYIHNKREKTERRNFSLRDQLKIQFRAAQKAQINERRAYDSKKRLTSYVFHEVRVPLNSALLAVQNMEAMGYVPKAGQFEWDALCGGLNMMSKVLNDVLDFDRLDAGRFTTTKTPFPIHGAIRSALGSLELGARQKGLTLTSELDKNIDKIAKRTALAANGSDTTTIAAELAKSDEDGVVVGDEMRLRQIINNLASNAVKFTPSGGQIRIVTKLILPLLPSSIITECTDTTAVEPAVAAEKEKEKGQAIPEDRPPASATAAERPVSGSGSKPASQHVKETEHSSLNSPTKTMFLWRWPSHRRRANTAANDDGVIARDMLDAAERGVSPGAAAPAASPTPLSTAQLVRHNSLDLNSLERIVVRIEVHDTGVGIRARDLVDNKLFSPYVQTEIGRTQGGKGTGLGLALVRRIVKLSGGRLGVKSKLGKGSTFWVELPLGVGKAILETKDRSDRLPDGSEYSERQRQLALGLEDLKFAHAIGEGDTPSSMVTEQDGTLVKDKDNDFGSVLTLHSKRALRNVMDQRGMIDIVRPPRLRGDVDDKDRVSRADKPPPTPFVTMPPTPPISGAETDNLAISAAELRTTDTANKHAGNGQEEAQTASDFPLPPVPHLVASQSTPAPLESSASSPSASVVLTTNSSIRGIRVLVVDDDEITRKLMMRMLTRLGCTVTLAENGKIALEKILGGAIPQNVLRGEPGTGMGMSTGLPPVQIEPIPLEKQVYLFDIIFLDNQMPIMSGLDVVAALRTLGRRDFVVGVTGNALLSDQQDYKDIGVDEVLTKPVKESSFKAMLREAIRRRHGRISAIQEAAAGTATSSAS